MSALSLTLALTVAGKSESFKRIDPASNSTSQPSAITQLVEKAGRLASQEQYENAIDTLNEALKEWAKLNVLQGSPKAWAIELQHGELLRRLGMVYYAKGDYSAAEKTFLEGLKIKENSFKSRGFPSEQAIGYDLLKMGLIYQALGKTDKAISSFSRANAQVDQLFYDDLFQNSNEDEKLAQEKIFISVATDMSLSFYLRSASDDSKFAALAIQTVLQRKGRILDASVSNREQLLRFTKPEDRPLLDNYLALRQRYRTLQNGLKNANAIQVIAELNALESQIRTLAAELEKRITYFPHDWRPLSLTEFQSKLASTEAWIDFISYLPFNERAVRHNERWMPRRYAACVLRRDKKPICEDIGDARELDDLLARLVCSLQFANLPLPPVVPELKRAYLAVFGKIDKYLTGMKTLHISAAGSVNTIPIGALINREGDYLIKTYSIHYFTSGQDFLRAQRTRRKGQRPVVLANPDFQTMQSKETSTAPSVCCESETYAQQIWKPAMFTSDLGLDIKSLFPNSQLLTGVAASKTALKGIRGPGILVFATHGFFLPVSQPAKCPPADEEPSSDDKIAQRTIWGRLYSDPVGRFEDQGLNDFLCCSGVALSGANHHGDTLGCTYGVLDARAVYQMDLWGTQLVVLAACQTGQGGRSVGEGIYGLRRAFSIAGAESQVVALWVVDAEATRHLLSDFFSYLTKGEGRAEALRKAQLDMLQGKNVKWQSPFYWAGFVESGAWTRLDPALFSN